MCAGTAASPVHAMQSPGVMGIGTIQADDLGVNIATIPAPQLPPPAIVVSTYTCTMTYCRSGNFHCQKYSAMLLSDETFR